MIRTCSVGGCLRQYYAKGYCSLHYKRWAKHGDPLVLGSFANTSDRSVPLAERFWAKVEKTDDHWLWTGWLNNKGYGCIWSLEEKRDVLAHRVSWQLNRGPIPAGFDVDHLCRTPACVRPEHLEPITHGENVRRGRAGERRKELAAQITHCPWGHRYTEANTYITVKGARSCRRCQRDRSRDRRLKD